MVTSSAVKKTERESFAWLKDAKRACDCAPTHINCMTAKDWTKAMIGVWEFEYEPADVRDKTLHPATFPLALAKKVVGLFTHKGETVLDPFNGSGTTVLACKTMLRNGIGIDLNKNYCTLAKKRLTNRQMEEYLAGKKEFQPHLVILNDDALNVTNYLPPDSIDLVLTSPPYANILNKERTNKSKRSERRADDRLGVNEQYSDDPRDLGTKPPDEFMALMSGISRQVFTVLKPGKHFVVNIRDVVPFFIQPPLITALTQVGFALKNIIIWDKRKQIQGMGIFGWPSNFIVLNSAYEYIFDFVKPRPDAA